MGHEADYDWSQFGDGTIHIICSSHNDIAWFDTPAATIAWRDTRSITPALERMAENPDVFFSMESVLYLLEYLERHPERLEELHSLVTGKRFDWGATYNQPYESLLSGEQLVREVYFGRRLLRNLLPGADPRVYYSPDVPGRTLQMPQVLAKAGVPYMMISRHRPSIFEWFSPDGSSVVAWSMGAYSETSVYNHTLDGSLDDIAKRVSADLETVSSEYDRRGLAPHFAYLNSADYIGPKDFDSLVDDWDHFRTQAAADGVKVPELRYSTPELFIDAAIANYPNLEAVHGERPNLWLYIHGPGHHHAVTAKRKAGSLLRTAEIFHTFAGLSVGSFDDYPANRLNSAWANSIYDDHGWGGHNGDLTDDVFLGKLVAAREAGRTLLDDALETIADQVDTSAVSGVPIVVFNSLSWPRTDLVSCKIPSQHRPFRIVDAAGREMAHQTTTPGTGIDSDLAFIAQDVPPLGYATYWLVPDTDQASDSTESATPSADPTDTAYENRFYEVELAPGGIRSLYDKEIEQEVFTGGKFLGGELFMIESVGNGAGEFGSIQQPTSVGVFERMSSYEREWVLSERGPVYTKYAMKQPMEHCVAVQEITFFETIKRVDFTVSLLGWNGSRSKEFRLAFPVNTGRDASIAYEVPLGIVHVGESEMEGRATDGPVYQGIVPDSGLQIVGPAYLDDNRDIHPREVQDFIGSVGPDIGVTLSSSVAVFDYVDPTTLPLTTPVLQPILLASRKSCHPQGNWYGQAGDHHFEFSLTSHGPDWTDGRRQGVQSNTELETVVGPQPGSGSLPDRASFLTISSDSCRVSTVKKAEDDDSVILRCYEVEGEAATLSAEFAFDVTEAGKTDIIEGGHEALPSGPSALDVAIGPYAIETYRLRFADIGTTTPEASSAPL